MQDKLEQTTKMQNLLQSDLDQITKMQNLLRNELEQIAKMGRIKKIQNYGKVRVINRSLKIIAQLL